MLSPQGWASAGFMVVSSQPVWLITSQLLFCRTSSHLERCCARTPTWGQGVIRDRGVDGWSENIHFVNDVCQLIHSPSLSSHFSGQTLKKRRCFLLHARTYPLKRPSPCCLALFMLSHIREGLFLSTDLAWNASWEELLASTPSRGTGVHGWLYLRRATPNPLNPQSPICP